MATKYKSISAAKKAGSIYYYDKNGTKQLAVTKETLDAWKKKNKGKYKGNSLTAWANNKGKNVGETGVTKSLRPKLRPKTKEAPKIKAAISDEQRKRQATTPKKALNNSAMSPAQQVEKLQKDIAKAKKDRAAKRAAIKQGQAEANKVLADTTSQKRPDSGVFKSLNKDLNAQRKASQTPKARADNRDPSDLKFDIYLGGMDKNKNKDNPRSKTRFPEGNVSSSRSGAKQGMIRAGDEENALDALAVKRAREKKMNMNKGGMTKGYNEGGLRMVKKGDEEVPFFAADGKGKMNKGGMTKKSGYMGGGMTKKKVMTYNMGGMVKSQTNNLKKGRS